MNTLYNTLSPFQIYGAFAVLFLFILCFCAVHGAKLLFIGWAQYKKQKTPPIEKVEKKEEKKAPAEQEPIYYIVERKRRRAKNTTSYGEPKRISFK